MKEEFVWNVLEEKRVSEIERVTFYIVSGSDPQVG